MKRLAFFICVLFLVFDLADDGCLGKARFINIPSPVKSLEVSYKHYGSEAPDCHHVIPQAKVKLPWPQSYSQFTKPVVQQSRKIVFTSLLSSAGGLPL
jgi:hypothetical protein